MGERSPSAAALGDRAKRPTFAEPVTGRETVDPAQIILFGEAFDGRLLPG